MAATFAAYKLAAAAVDTEQAAAVDNNTNNFDTTLTRLNIVAFICYYMIQLKDTRFIIFSIEISALT